MCVYKYAYEKTNNRQLFWDYVKNVHQECDSKINEECSIFAHKQAKIPWTETLDCVKKSFSKDDWLSPDVNNTLIDQDIDYWLKYGSGLFPAIVINNSTYRGQLETQQVMNAICAGFQEPPKMCKRLLSDQDILMNIGEGVIYFNDGYTPEQVIGIASIYIVAVLLFLCCYRRSAKRQMKRTMNVQIETAVNNYIALAQKDETERNV